MSTRLSAPLSISPGYQYAFNQGVDNIGIKRRHVQEFLANPPAKIPRPRPLDGPSPFVVNMVNSLPDSVNDLLRIFPDLLPSQPTVVPISVTPRLINPFFNYNTHLEQKVVKSPLVPPPVLEPPPPVLEPPPAPLSPIHNMSVKNTNTNNELGASNGNPAPVEISEAVQEQKKSRTRGQASLTDTTESKAGRIYSNDMAHCCKHQCRVCNKIYTMTAMRGHTRTHNITIKEYTDKYGSPRDNIITEVWHKCGLCFKEFLLDSDNVHKHANWHQMKLKEYNARFITLVTPQRANKKEKEEEPIENKTEGDVEENKTPPLHIKEERKDEDEADDNKVEEKKMVSLEESSKENEKVGGEHDLKHC